jgi:predicted dienelactone hydrolase
MRPLEMVLLIGELLTFLVLVAPPLRSFRRLSVVLVMVLAPAQFILEGSRWQMVPAYVLSCLFLAMSLVRTTKSDAAARPVRQRVLAGMGLSLGALALTLAAALPELMPVFHFPQPKGPYGIGTVTYHWVDASRPDIFDATPGGHRELMVQVWYPAHRGQETRRAPYVAPGTRFAALNRLAHLPPFFLDHLEYVTTNAQPSAPMAAAPARFPVLVFSPGRGGFRQNSTFQVEELVSRGYVVVGIDHPYTVADVVFPDGRHIALDPRVAASMLDEHVVNDTFMLAVFDNLGQDAVFALNQLPSLDSGDPERRLTGRLDLQHVGILGSSLGGIAAAEACRLDRRFQCCLMLDVAAPPDVVRSGLQQPAMWISATPETKRREGWTPSAIREQETTTRDVFSSLPGDGYRVLIPGMFHAEIGDTPYIFARPLGTWLGITGPADWRRTHIVINAYSLAFFDKYLKGEPQALLSEPSEARPEVMFERRR